jgi:hypothetical protein
MPWWRQRGPACGLVLPRLSYRRSPSALLLESARSPELIAEVHTVRSRSRLFSFRLSDFSARGAGCADRERRRARSWSVRAGTFRP